VPYHSARPATYHPALYHEVLAITVPYHSARPATYHPALYHALYHQYLLLHYPIVPLHYHTTSVHHLCKRRVNVRRDCKDSSCVGVCSTAPPSHVQVSALGSLSYVGVCSSCVGVCSSCVGVCSRGRADT